jgi:hypothetical protein
MSTWCARPGSVDLGHKAKPYNVQTAVNIVRAQGAASLVELAMGEVKPPARLFLAFAADQVALALSDRESEAKKDD